MRTEELLKILSSKTKAQIILRLLDCRMNPSVGNLCDQLNLKQSNVSKHLMDLRRLKVVEYNKNGRESIYKLNDEFVNEHKDVIVAIAEKSKCQTFKLVNK